MKLELSKKEIKDLYFDKNMSLQKICDIKFITNFRLSKLFKFYNIPKKTHSDSCLRYKFNKDYFEVIDNEHKAYWLGWMYSDGCVHSNESIIELTSKDLHILEMFVKDMDSDKHIIPHRNKEEKCLYYSVKFVHKKLKQDLIKLGCVPAKSLILTFPTEEQVPKNLIHHFIRGYFDGDGSVGNYLINSNRVLNGVFLGTKDFMEGVQSNVESPSNISKQGNIFRLNYKNKNTLSLYEYMYKNSSIWLERKKTIFENYIQINMKEKPIFAKLVSTNEIVGLYQNKTEIMKEHKIGFYTLTNILEKRKMSNKDINYCYIYPETLYRKYLIHD